MICQYPFFLNPCLARDKQLDVDSLYHSRYSVAVVDLGIIPSSDLEYKKTEK